MELLPHQIALNKAKIQLMQKADTAFYTTVCFSLKHVWDDTIPTACTDGVEIRMNPEFFMKLNPEEQLFLLLHETDHVACSHMIRGKGYDRKRYNIAADHVINLRWLERGLKMPKGGLADPQYAGMSTEDVYHLLPENSSEDYDEDVLPYPGDDDEVAQQAIQDILVRAAVQSKMQGDGIGAIPGEIQIFLDKLLNPKLPWQRILQKYVRAKAKSDYTFKKPNRRFFPQHYLPSLHSESLMDLAIAVDTSGSVSDAEFTQFVSEIASVFKMMKPEKITLIQFDTELKLVTEVKSLNALQKITFSGRGGTDIRPVLDWANEHKPQVLLVFTDGDFHFRKGTTKVDTLWIIHNNPQFKSEFGKVISYEV